MARQIVHTDMSSGDCREANVFGDQFTAVHGTIYSEKPPEEKAVRAEKLST